MSAMRSDKQTFRNEDLVLKVSTNINPAVWDESKYEAFLDELCDLREYQKDAIRTVLRILCGGKYSNLRELTKENFDINDEMQRQWILAGMNGTYVPDQLSFH
jgi:hypothetical protein